MGLEVQLGGGNSMLKGTESRNLWSLQGTIRLLSAWSKGSEKKYIKISLEAGYSQILNGSQ